MSAKAEAAQQTRVLIVAESGERRAVLRALLSESPEFTIHAVTADFSQIQAGLNVIVVDLENDFSFSANTLGAFEGGLVLLSDNPDVNWIASSPSLRPIALIRRDCRREQIVAAVQAVAAGLSVFESDTMERLWRPPLDTIALEPGEEELTPRETEILNMMTAGVTNREIASALGISEHTVKFHLASIFGKLGTSTRTETVTEGIRRGLIVL